MSSRTSAACGLGLLLLGLLLLVGSLGLIRVDLWRFIVPAILIGLGAFTIRLAITRGGARQAETIVVPAGEATSASIQFRFGAGRLRVGGGAGDPNLLELTAYGGASHSVTTTGHEADLRVWIPTGFLGDVLAPWRWGEQPPEWDARLSKGVPLRLDFETGACEADLDLTELVVPELRLATGASSVTVRMPASAGETRARISAGAASVRVRVPPGVAARIKYDVGLGEVKADRTRFPRTAEGYESPGFAASPNRLELTVELGAASVEIA